MRLAEQDYRRFLDELDERYNKIWANLPAGVKKAAAAGGYKTVKKTADKVLAEGRPPRIYLLGRQNVGKSSLVNALTGEDKAKVTAITPQKAAEPPYRLKLGDAGWEIFDRDGFDEAIGTDGAKPNLKKVDDLAKDVQKVKPDILLFLVDGANPASILSDLKGYERVVSAAAKKGRVEARTVAVLTKVDNLHGGQFRDLFPLDPKSRSRQVDECRDAIEEALQLFMKATSIGEYERFKRTRYEGFEVVDSKPPQSIRFVVPVVSVSEPRVRKHQWNIQTLRDAIVAVLPPEAQRDFARGVNDPRTYRAVANRLRKWFGAAAGATGALQADLLVYNPMRDLAVGTIAGLAGRDMTLATVDDFIEQAATSEDDAKEERNKILQSIGQVTSTVGKLWPFGKGAAEKAASKTATEVAEKGVKKAGGKLVGAGLAAGLVLLDAALAFRRMDKDLAKAIDFFFE